MRTVELPDEVYRNLARVAEDSGLTPAEWIAASVSRSNGPASAGAGQPSPEGRPLSEALKDLIGVVDSGKEPPSIKHRSKVEELVSEKFRKQGIGTRHGNPD